MRILTPWTSQPQGPVEIDWSNPITRGLIYADYPGAAKNLSVTGVGKYGRESTFRGQVSSDPRLSSASFSFYLLFKTEASLGSQGCVIGRGSTSNDYNNRGFGFSPTHSAPAYSGAFYCGDSYTIIGKPTGAALSADTNYSIAGTCDGAYGRAYNNGILSAGPVSVSSIDTTANLVINKSSGVNPSADDSQNKIYFVGYWNRALSDTEVRSISQNPWQIFKPVPRRIFVPVATSGNATLYPSLYTNDQTYYAPTVSQSGGAQTLTPSLFTGSQDFYAATVSATKTLTQALYQNAQEFYSPTLSATYSLAPTLHTNTSSFFAPTVVPGTVTLAPSLFTNDQSYYSHVLNQAGGPQNVAPNLYTNSSTFYSHTLAPGAVSLAPSLYSNDQTFYSLTLTTTKTLTASLHTNDQTFFGPVVTQEGGLQYVVPSLFENTQSYFSHTVTTGQVQLYPVLLDNAQSFYAHTVSQGALPTIARPNSDISNTGWTPSTGSDLYAMLDEVTPDDADYISTSILGAVCEFGMNATQYPGGASQQLSLRASSSTGNGILVTIKDGATTIASRTLTLTPTFDLHTITLTSGEIAAITSGNLTVEMTST